jgi:hypothetical protein
MDIPVTRDRVLDLLQPYQVAARLKNFKKPSSMVPTDIFPALVTKFCDFLALPLTDVYNSIISTGVWPVAWKNEFVTDIPKKKLPENMNDLRNILCTALVSKVFESYLLDWLKSEVKLKRNQFGGVKGSSVQHHLCNIWHKFGTNLEDNRAATVLTAIDYVKAFNRLDYKSCLRSLARKGASSQIFSLVATFLTNRSVQLRVEKEWSDPLPVTGGVPQGSFIGVFLFNMATDDLESGPNVYDTGALLPLDGGEDEQSSEDGSLQSDENSNPEEGPQACSTPVPARVALGEDGLAFGTPTGKDSQILRTLRGEGGAVRFVGRSLARNSTKARRKKALLWSNREPSAQGGTGKVRDMEMEE